MSFIFLFVFGVIDKLFLSALSLTSGFVTSAHNLIRLSLAARLATCSAGSFVVPIVVINFNLAKLTGPVIGGWLIAVWGAKTALLIQTLFYVHFIPVIGTL